MRPRRALLGQHFLRNREATRRAIRTLELARGDFVFEIGPGRGALTVPLGRACKKNGARLLAIEKDADLVREVKFKIEEAGLTDTAQIVHGDALRVLPSYVLRLASPYKIAGNIPYAITGRLLRILGEAGEQPPIAILMIQREVAERIAAYPPRMNLLAASVRFWAKPNILMALEPADFSPPPEVRSALITLVRRKTQTIQPHAYYALIRALFRHPRKTILNNLAEGLARPKNELEPMLKAAGCPPAGRPQDCAPELLINLASRLSAYGIL